jgi:hypothetical protein
MPGLFGFLGLPVDAEVCQYHQQDMVLEWVKRLGPSITGMVEVHLKLWAECPDKHLRMKECYDTACLKLRDFAEHRMEGIRDANARNHFVAETFQASWSFIFSSFASSLFHVRQELICDFLPDSTHPMHEFLVQYGVYFQHSRRLPESLWWKSNDPVQCFTPLEDLEVPSGADMWGHIQAYTSWLRTDPAFRDLVEACYENDFYNWADTVKEGNNGTSNTRRTPYKPDRLYPPQSGRDMMYWILPSDVAHFIRLYVAVADVTQGLEDAGIDWRKKDFKEDGSVKAFLSKLRPAKLAGDLQSSHTRVPGYRDGNYCSQAVEITCNDVIKHVRALGSALMLQVAAAPAAVLEAPLELDEDYAVEEELEPRPEPRPEPGQASGSQDAIMSSGAVEEEEGVRPGPRKRKR